MISSPPNTLSCHRVRKNAFETIGCACTSEATATGVVVAAAPQTPAATSTVTTDRTPFTSE